MANGPSPGTGKTPAGKKRVWAPRMWEGCDFFAWFRLLVRNRFAVHWSYLYIAVVVTFVSVFHTLLRFIQDALYGERIRRTPIRHPPLFILGHWRTGTTLLHELLILDERHGHPTTYECLAPNHFLLSEGVITRWLAFLMPSRRPMDNMAAGFDRPQEDEFALCMLGQPSPYLTIAFPNRPPQDQEYLDLEGVPPRALASWKQTFYRFLQQITVKDPRRLVLKSPPHTCRIKVLRELFPDALFVHIVRDPYVVFPSTVNLWKSLYRTHGLQPPTFAGLEEQVYQTFLRMHDRLEETRGLIDPKRFYELRYEDLVRDPVGQLRALYEHLGLAGFERVLPRLQSYLASVAGYETNRYQLSPEQRAEIARRWGRVIERYAYGDGATAGAALSAPPQGPDGEARQARHVPATPQ
jgi:omega-hydroxy-beta-dihydromenaquinone-9 sulfotransferase